MRSSRVVPEKPIRQFLVHLVRIMKKRKVPVNELLLDRAVEPFAMGIHLRCPWIGVPMNSRRLVELGLEGLHELRAVVREDVLNWIREGLEDSSEDVSGFFRTMAPCRERHGKARVNINRCHEVAFCSMHNLLNGIERNTFPRFRGNVPFWLSCLYFSIFSLDSSSGATRTVYAHAHLQRIVCDETANS